MPKQTFGQPDTLRDVLAGMLLDMQIQTPISDFRLRPDEAKSVAAQLAPKVGVAMRRFGITLAEGRTFREAEAAGLRALQEDG